MSRDEVATILPYGLDFLFIDVVNEMKRGESITTSMKYDEEHPLQAAHFARGPRVVPGALIAEQVCQSAFLLGILSGELGAGDVCFLGRIQSVFEKPSLSPCSVTAVVLFKARLGGAIGFSGEAFSSGERIARVTAAIKRITLSELNNRS